MNRGNVVKQHLNDQTPLPRGVRRYKKGRIIAPTIFGSIRYGKDIVTGEWVVIKECVIENLIAKKSVQGNFVPEDVHMEIELHSRLCQPNDSCPYIIDLKEVCQDKEYIYIILEYASGGDLFGFVKTSIQKIIGLWKTTRKKEVRRRIVEEWQNSVQKWIRQLLLALKFMHERNICHGDISLENIVLGKDKDVKVIDLGVAHEYEDGNFSSERKRIGKEKYMSPECHLGQYYDGRDNDMWCAGVVLWLCLVGCPPWDLPCVSDKRFVLVMRGKSGIKKLVSRWRRWYLVSDPAVDLLSKIFRPQKGQKERITVGAALRHPFISGDDSKSVPPAAWSKITKGEKDAIQKYLWSINKSKSSIFDRRVTQEMMSRFKITPEEVHEILIYYKEASRICIKPNSEKDISIVKSKLSPVLKYNVSEQKAHDHIDNSQRKEAADKSSLKGEQKKKLNLIARFEFNQKEDEGRDLHIEADATLDQLKLDFSVLGTKTLNLPFIPPNMLDIFVDGAILRDTVELQDGNVLSGKFRFKSTGPKWFCELSREEREKYFAILVSMNQDCKTTVNFKEKFLEKLSITFRIEHDKCKEVWEYFTQESLLLSNLKFRDQISLNEIAKDFFWLKVLSSDVIGSMFALVLGNIVIANMGNKRTRYLLEEKGLTRDKAIQAIEHFS